MCNTFCCDDELQNNLVGSEYSKLCVIAAGLFLPLLVVEVPSPAGDGIETGLTGEVARD